eukprot:IDg3075t1
MSGRTIHSERDRFRSACAHLRKLVLPGVVALQEGGNASAIQECRSLCVCKAQDDSALRVVSLQLT